MCCNPMFKKIIYHHNLNFKIATKKEKWLFKNCWIWIIWKLCFFKCLEHSKYMIVITIDVEDSNLKTHYKPIEESDTKLVWQYRQYNLLQWRML